MTRNHFQRQEIRHHEKHQIHKICEISANRIFCLHPSVSPCRRLDILSSFSHFVCFVVTVAIVSFPLNQIASADISSASISAIRGGYIFGSRDLITSFQLSRHWRVSRAMPPSPSATSFSARSRYRRRCRSTRAMPSPSSATRPHWAENPPPPAPWSRRIDNPRGKG